MDWRTLVRKGPTLAAVLFLTLAGTAGAEVYKWRDDDGKLHFSDEPPSSGQAEDLSERYNAELPFSLEFETVNYALPTELRNQLSVTVKKIFTIYRQALNLEYNPERAFRIVLHGDRSSFREYQQKIAPRLENPAGFYNSASNQITALAVDNRRALTALITHECSHAVSASGDTYVPIWLNEGLAEYFSRMRVHGLTAEIPLNRRALHTLKRRNFHRDAPELREHVNASPDAWQQANGADNLSYSLSWSLVYFLMDSEEGRSLIRTLLERARNSPLPLRDSAAIIEQNWEGGLNALTREWQDWLRNAEGKHRY